MWSKLQDVNMVFMCTQRDFRDSVAKRNAFQPKMFNVYPFLVLFHYFLSINNLCRR